MPEQSPSDEAQKKRGKRLIVLSLAAMLIAAGVLGTMFYRSRQLVTDAVEKSRKQQPIRLTKPQKDAHLEKATLLRVKWRVWALKHKEILQRLLAAQPNDRAAVTAVWNALPDDVDTVAGSITNNDLVPTKDLSSAIESRTPIFSWEPVDKSSLTQDSRGCSTGTTELC